MTHRERYLETLLFGAPDRIPFQPGGGRESTLRVWRQQGLPEGRNYMDIIHEQIDAKRAEKGLPPADWHPRQKGVDHGVSFQMNPKFEEKVLEHKEGHYIVQDWMGAVTEISDEYDYTYIREAKDFVTRRWHKWPVENWDDWENMKWRFNPDDPARYPDDFEERCAILRERDYPMVVHFNGPFWQLREFCGMEGLCMLMLTQPDLVHAMAEFWGDFTTRVLENITSRVTPDELHFSEDMCFKEHPMIGPDQTREFCGPCYGRWYEATRDAGTSVFAIDSDGRIDLLIDVWMDYGINCVDPMEVAAGNDINALREHYGKKLAFRGGIDKRAMAAGGAVLDAELERVRPVIESGGYIPGCDHGVPPDVSWPNFQDYCLKLAGMTGWLD
jgi:uroporphyrinogen decarboxylase